MTEMPGEGLLSGIGEEFDGVQETATHAVEGIADAAAGNWTGAADKSLSMAESALGVATGGLFTAGEAGWDAVAHETGLPTAHQGLGELTQKAGDALGDGLFDLVGADQARQSTDAFDNGDILGGLGHMAEGAAQTISGALEHEASAAGGVLGDLFGGGSGQADELATADPGVEAAAESPWDNPDPSGDDAGYDQSGYDASAEAIN